MIRHRYLPSAREELNEAAAFYGTSVPGLGEAFLDDVERAIETVRQSPGIGALVGRPFRKAILRRFPFTIVYAQRDEEIVNDHLIIRLATQKDAEAIALESMAEIEHNFEWTWHPHRVGRAIDDLDTNVVVAVDSDAMLGFGIMKYEEEVAHLVLFAVREDMRRRGIGSAVLIWLEKVASVAGVCRFRVEARLTNAGARAFYRSHGYVESEVVPGMYRDTEDGVRFEKVIVTAVKEA